jgi:ABC-type nitrate/sulfonate/bicarbonate transport system substrate-binding protein
MSHNNFSRREVIRGGVLGGLALAAGAHVVGASRAAAASPARPTSAGRFGTLTYQFNWINGAGWGASYLADDKGLFIENGFDGPVEFLYGGPNIVPEPVVVSGRALLGQSASENVASAVGQGADLKILGARFQQNPYSIVSLEENPIRTADDLPGKRIGVGASNEALWAALLTRLQIDPSTITKVPVQFDPSPLINGEIDGFLGYSTNQPVTLQIQGIPYVNVLLSDFGFNLYQQVYITNGENLSSNRDALVAALKAEAAGYQYLRQDPQAAIDLWNEKYADGIEDDPEYSLLSIEAALELGVSDTTETEGYLTISEAGIAENLETLSDIGLEVPASVYDRSLWAEVYADGLDLISGG